MSDDARDVAACVEGAGVTPGASVRSQQ
jgi:hypothetical protein